MERIKEALDRVKADREAAESAPADNTPNLTNDAVSAAAATTPAPPPQPRREAPIGNAEGRSKAAARDVLPLNPRHLERHRIVAHQKHNPHSGTFDLLRTQVLHKMSKNGWTTLGVVSPAPGAGKSVVSINLALSIAQLRDRTSFLLDFDLRRPSVLSYLGIKPEVSLNDVLDGQADLADAMLNPLLPGFSLAAASRPIPLSAELLGSERLAELISEVKGRYSDRIVIVDLPPVLNADDALAVMPNLDAVLVVIGSGMSSRHEVEETLRHLPTPNLLGTVLNKAKVSTESYTYGY